MLSGSTKLNVVVALIFTTTILIFILDYLSPVGIIEGAAYTLVVLLTLWLPDRLSTLLTMGMGIALTFLDISITHGAFTRNALINQAISVVLLVASGLLILHYKSTLKHMHEEEKKLNALFEASTEGIMISDRTGAIIMMNRMAEQLFGYKREELIGENIDKLVPARMHDRHSKLRDRYYEHPITRPMGQGIELVIKTKDNRELPVEISLNYFYQDEEIFVISHIMDITERRKAQSQLKQAYTDLQRSADELKRSNAELEQFAYVASHDLQEPLRMVTSYTELLEKRYSDRLDDDAQDFMHYAVDGARRMRHLINDLLQYSRLGTKAKPFEETDSGQLAEAAVKNLEKLIHEEQAQVCLEGLPRIKGDVTQLTQLFQNLIQNAIKFRGEEAPRVRIDVEDHPAYWEFIVSDNGIGIEPEYRDRIFMIFQRLHNRDVYPGSGIGLALCKKIVERHEGEIWVQSEPGKGTDFHFTISKHLN